MSRSRQDLRKKKQRHDRIRREKHAQRAEARPAPDPESIPELQHPFAMERSLRQIGSLLEGQEFGSIDEVNERLEKLTSGGRMPEMAGAWNQDDPKWRAQDMAYDALEADDPMEALRLAHEALELDPDCVDAERLMITLLPIEPDNRIDLTREILAKTERLLGEEFFEENMGHFWGVTSTRPYMRTLNFLSDQLVDSGALEEAIEVFERMIELNSTDNQGVRNSLLALYLATSRLEDARSLFSRFPDEHKLVGTVAWGLLLERWLAGNLAEAEVALQRAREVNPHVEPYISGARRQPEDTPRYYRLGDESEAAVCAAEMGIAWKSHPEFRKWVRSLR